MTNETREQAAERRAIYREYERKRQAAIRADPDRHAAFLKQRAEARRRLRAEAKAVEPVPPSIDLSLYRAHGPFAQLFSLQRSA